jgi:hypothetical protein
MTGMRLFIAASLASGQSEPVAAVWPTADLHGHWPNMTRRVLSIAASLASGGHGMASAASTDAMLEIARPEVRAQVRSRPADYRWGIVDVILALILLPFGVWFLLIDRTVAVIAWIIDDMGPALRLKRT